jgi:hypothetical protein
MGWIRDPGKNLSQIPDPDPGVKKNTESWIQIRDTDCDTVLGRTGKCAGPRHPASVHDDDGGASLRHPPHQGAARIQCLQHTQVTTVQFTLQLLPSNGVIWSHFSCLTNFFSKKREGNPMF